MTTLDLHDAAAADEHRDAVWTLYDAVFGDHATRQTWQEEMWDRHRGRECFRLATAYDGGAAGRRSARCRTTSR